MPAERAEFHPGTNYLTPDNFAIILKSLNHPSLLQLRILAIAWRLFGFRVAFRKVLVETSGSFRPGPALSGI